MSLPNNPRQKTTTMQGDFGTSIAVALWKRYGQMANYFDKSWPIGMLMFFHATQDNLPATPDSKYWKELDGSVVSNADSPLNGVTLPDLRDKFIRHPMDGETVLTTFGADTIDLQHSHSGFTGNTDARLAFDVLIGNTRYTVGVHNHIINTALSTTQSTLPLYRAVKLYIRIA